MFGFGGPIILPSTTGGSGPWWIGALLIGLVVAAYVLYAWRTNLTYRHEHRIDLPEKREPSVREHKAA